ncbi:MAG TPA: hypothetical protein VES20_25640 [Bryobacteraceae bacterium]|nr:hypothetical protein [Bryobacteraceae bacterium]
MLVPALGNGDICTVPSLWDGQTDGRDGLSVSIDVQTGDVVEVTLSLTGAGCFAWTCACRAGIASPIGNNHGVYTGDTPSDLTALNDRSWMTLLQSNAVQTLTLGIDHAAAMTITHESNMSATPGYRIGQVTLAACVIAKNY